MKKITASLLALAWPAARFARPQDKNFPDSASIAIHSKYNRVSGGYREI